MSWGSVPSFVPDLPFNIQEAIGVGQFPSLGAWNFQFNGFKFQGGPTAVVGIGGNLLVPFSAPFEKEVLGIFLQPVGAAANYASVTPNNLNEFTINNGPVATQFYWWAIGV